MIALFASIFALGIGPLIYQTFGPLRRTDKIVSGFILAFILITLFLEVLPETFSLIGYLAFILVFIGFYGPTLIEKQFKKLATKTHLLTIVLGLLGLVLHATIDGAALYPSDSAIQYENLSVAIILHRLPVGLTIWWLLKPLLGERYALSTLLAMALATTGGYFLSMELKDYFSNDFFVALQALISGSLLHVILHKPYADGCMHTSLDHSHQHPVKNKIKSFLPERWELLGIFFALLVTSILHLFFE